MSASSVSRRALLQRAAAPRPPPPPQQQQLLATRSLHVPASASASLLGARRRPLAAPCVAPAPQLQPSAMLLLRLGGARHSTLWRAVQEGIQGKQAEKEEEQFRAEMQRLAGLDKYDLQTFKEAMDNAEKGSWFSWVNKMPGVRSMPEVQMGERYKKILGAVKEEELRKPDLIKAREKQRIAQQSGETVQEINLLLKLYDNSVALHQWVRRRVRDGKDLPKTRAECQLLMMGDPAGMSATAFQQRQQKRAAKRGRLPF